MHRGPPTRRHIAAVSVALFVGAALYATSIHGYLLFHGLVEVLTIGLACSVFLVTWNARDFEDNGYFLFVGIGSLFASGFAFVHMLAYKGMGVFPGSGTNLPTQLWISARLILAATLLVAPRHAGRKLDHRFAFAGFGAVASLLAAAIAAGIFPVCYVEGVGLTPFKIWAEYLLCAMFIGSLAALLRRKSFFHADVLRFFVAATVASIFSELAFSLYRTDVFGYINLLGHYFAVAAFYLMYEAVVGTELVRRYALQDRLARELRERERTEEALRAAKEGLEARVAERTEELTRSNEALRAEVSARRAAEESLGRTAEFLRTVEMSMRAGVSVVDLEGRYIYVNRAFCRIVGWREEELLGQKPPYPFWPPEDADRLRLEHDAEMRGEAPRGGREARCRRSDGTLFDALTLPSPLLDDRGLITGRLTVLYDITERKRAERELLEANQKLHALIESSPLAIVVRGIDDLVTVWNPAAERMFGWTEDEALGRPMPIIPPESADEYRDLKDAILRGAALQRVEFRRARKDGSPIDVSISTALLRDGAGTATGIMAIFEDVTGRKRMQEELAESEARFRSLVENSPAGLCLVRGGRVLFSNPEMERLFGRIPPGFEFRRYRGVLPDDSAKFRRLCDALERPDPPLLDVDIRFRATQGPGREIRWVHARTNPVDYRGGKATLVSLIDITRLKELEHLARTREKMASLGHVAAGIAHEIRNPLSGLNIYLSNLEAVLERSDGLEPDDRETFRDVISQMRSASLKIESVIRRVMDFSRPHPVQLAPGSVNVAVKEAVALSQVFLRKQGIRLTMSLDEELAPVPADLAMLEQVILNLITNAAEAMERTEGRREIEIASFRERDAAVVAVSDSGPGVPVELRDQIFDPFYTTRTDGSGIGLSICRRVVLDHGGTLSVRTGKWGGAEFRVALPFEREDLVT